MYCIYCAVRAEYLTLIWVNIFLPCRDWDGYSPASHRRGPSSIAGKPMWILYWKELRWDRFFSEYFAFILTVSFHLCYLIIFIYMLLLPERQMGEAWESSNRQCSFVSRGALNRKVDLLSLFFEWLTLRLLMSYIYGGPILDVSRSHTTTQHSR